MVGYQKIEDENHKKKLADLPEHGMGYQYVEAAINGDDPEVYLVRDGEIMIKPEDYDEYMDLMYPRDGDRTRLQEKIADGTFKQYYDEIKEFDVETCDRPATAGR